MTFGHSTWLGSMAAGGLLAMLAGPALAASVPGTASIYAVAGSTNPTNDATLAPSLSIVGGQSYFISASGALNCCSGDPTFNGGPDGIQVPPFFTSTVGLAVNGLSPLTGNSFLGLVGVFGDGTDPRVTSTSPADLTFNANSPSSASPLLWQIFYIGDGRQGLNNSLGNLLTFTAPTSATLLYLGFIDHGPNGAASPCCYGDNVGSLQVDVAATPLPAALPLFGSAIAGMGLLSWRRRRWARA